MGASVALVLLAFLRDNLAMRTLIDHVNDCVEVFSKRAFTPADALVFSQLAYVTWDSDYRITSRRWRKLRIGKAFTSQESPDFVPGLLNHAVFAKFLAAVAESPRYAETEIVGFIDRVETNPELQFSACCFLLSDGTAVIAYRGTDETIIGWRESVAMSYEEQIPAQACAVSFLDEIAGLVDRPLRIVGHSKGGNLAVYAALAATEGIRRRILEVWDLDGPGFNLPLACHPGYQSLRDRIYKVVPTSSVVGMLMDRGAPYRVVSSTGLGLWQHDCLSWGLVGSEIDYQKNRGPGAAVAEAAAGRWMASTTALQRQAVAAALFDVIDATGSTNVLDLTSIKRKKVRAAVNALQNVDPAVKAVVRSALPEIFPRWRSNK